MSYLTPLKHKNLDPVEFFDRALHIARRYGYPKSALVFLITDECFDQLKWKSPQGFDFMNHKYWGVDYEVVLGKGVHFDLLVRMRLADYFQDIDKGDLPEDNYKEVKPVFFRFDPIDF